MIGGFGYVCCLLLFWFGFSGYDVCCWLRWLLLGVVDCWKLRLDATVLMGLWRLAMCWFVVGFSCTVDWCLGELGGLLCGVVVVLWCV